MPAESDIPETPTTPTVPLQKYLDERMQEIRRAADAAALVPIEGVPLRQYVEAVLEEQRNALGVASAEREKAAQALATEREKTAQALAVALRAQVETGDQALRDHIKDQVSQIRAALDALHREMTLIYESSEKAIMKAENANEKRFESVNEWRGQSLDRERTQQEQTSMLTATFLPREVAEAKFAELNRKVDELGEKIGKLV